ncbi:MAG TPA: polyprenol monophosphomannose synthase [Solirubrobacteraceae bacterium]|nr:polyprenol monophosphomannose synthase [Solirubrobacteraceae bacterium]
MSDKLRRGPTDRLGRRLGTAGRWAWRHFRLVAGIALVAGLALTLAAHGEALAAVDWTIEPRALAAAIALLAVAPLAQGLTLAVALRRLGAGAPAAATLRVWARSFLLRYEPSGAVGFVYRVRERERLAATTPQVLAASGYEQLAAVTAGAIVAVVAFAAAGARPPLIALVLAAALATAAVAVRPALLGHRLARGLARRGVAVAGPMRGRTLALLVAIDATAWAATGTGAALLAEGLLGAAAPSALVLLGAFALSLTVGALLPLLPAGLGPRDAALTAALAPVAGAGPAALLAIALRVASLAGELLAVAGAEIAALLLARREQAAVTTPTGATGALGAAPPLEPSGEPRTIVVVPTYDEREALPLFVARFAAPGMDLLIVDDGSPDGTGELAEELAATRPWMHVLHRAQKDGLGMAYRAGFAWCLRRGYAVVGQMDCDLSHPPEKLAEMRDVLLVRDVGLVLASRYLPGGGTDGWSATRLALSRLGCAASRLALGLPFSDLSGGFKLWRADCLAAIEMDELLSAGYAFQVETTQLAHLAGARIEEVPFVFSERVAGASKMTLRITLEGIRVTLTLRRRNRPARRHGVCAAL